MADVDLSSVLSLAIAGVTLQVEDYQVTETPVIQQELGRIWTDVVVEAMCVLDFSGTLTDYQTALVNTITPLRIDGQDFVIKGLAGTPEYSLLAALCLNNGPQITIQMTSGDGVMSKRFKATARCQRFNPGSGPTNSYTLRIQTLPDGRQIFTRSGVVIGPNSANYYNSTVLAAAKSAYPLPGYVFDSEYEASQDGNLSKTTYSIKAQETFDALPHVQQDTVSVDGEVITKSERDEHHRMTLVTSIDLKIIGDPQQMLDKFRTAAKGADGNTIILRESWQVTTIQEQHLTGSFTTLASADKQPLMNWTETIVLENSDAGWEIKTYPGTAPIVVRRPTTLAKITQTGEAIAVGKFKRPTPLFNSFLEAPQVTLTDVNDVEKRTSWRFVMYPSTGGNAPDSAYDTNGFDPSPIARSAQDDNYFGTKGAT